MARYLKMIFDWRISEQTEAFPLAFCIALYFELHFGFGLGCNFWLSEELTEMQSQTNILERTFHMWKWHHTSKEKQIQGIWVANSGSTSFYDSLSGPALKLYPELRPVYTSCIFQKMKPHKRLNIFTTRYQNQRGFIFTFLMGKVQLTSL